MRKILLLIICLLLFGSAGTALANSQHWGKGDPRLKDIEHQNRHFKHKCGRSDKLGYNFNTNNDFMWWCLINGRVK